VSDFGYGRHDPWICLCNAHDPLYEGGMRPVQVVLVGEVGIGRSEQLPIALEESLLATDLESTGAHWAVFVGCSGCVQARTNQRLKEQGAEVVLVGKEQVYDIEEGRTGAWLLRVWAADMPDRMTVEAEGQGSRMRQVVLVAVDCSLEWHRP
jgi:hypothetical protein